MFLAKLSNSNNERDSTLKLLSSGNKWRTTLILKHPDRNDTLMVESFANLGSMKGFKIVNKNDFRPGQNESRI